MIFRRTPRVLNSALRGLGAVGVGRLEGGRALLQFRLVGVIHRALLTLFLAVMFAVAATAADDNVRTVQAKLKEGGFYFGEVNGALSSDLSAAITRYQIRNGLQITGNLNAETSKALGVKPEVTAPQSTAAGRSAPPSETWRSLRKPERRAVDRRAPDAPPQTLQPVGDGAKMALSPERLRDYVAAFVLAGLDPHVGAELEFFADRVRYYNDGIVSRDKIRGDLVRYDTQWPQRRFWLAGKVEVAPQPDSRLRVTFPLRFELQNGRKHASGRVRKTLLLEVRGDDLQIVGVDETKA